MSIFSFAAATREALHRGGHPLKKGSAPVPACGHLRHTPRCIECQRHRETRAHWPTRKKPHGTES